MSTAEIPGVSWFVQMLGMTHAPAEVNGLDKCLGAR